MKTRPNTTTKTLLGFVGILVLASIIVSWPGSEANNPINAGEKPAIEGLRQLSDGFVAVAKAVKPGVVNIATTQKLTRRNMPKSPLDEFFERFGPRFQPMPDTPKRKGLGSGFVYSEDGYIVTNAHVVDGADEISVNFSDGRSFDAEIRGVDKKADVAVLKIDADGLTPLALGKSSELEVGEIVVAIGSPFGLDQTVTSGIVSAKGRYGMGIEAYEDFIQTDAAINPGNSGGPLLDLDGRVIGINTAIFSRTGSSAGIGFAIPIDMARNIAGQLIRKGKVTRGWLGVEIQEMSPELADHFDLPEGTNGVVVAGVVDGTPAAKAKMKSGDVIIGYDGKEIENINELRHSVANTPPGEVAKVKVLRDGREKTLSVKIAEQTPEALAQRSSVGRIESRIGISAQNLTKELAERLGLEQTSGVIITDVEAGSPAEKSELRRGDLVLKVDKMVVRNVEDLRKALSKVKPGDTAALLIRRDNISSFVLVKVPKE